MGLISRCKSKAKGCETFKVPGSHGEARHMALPVCRYSQPSTTRCWSTSHFNVKNLSNSYSKKLFMLSIMRSSCSGKMANGEEIAAISSLEVSVLAAGHNNKHKTRSWVGLKHNPSDPAQKVHKSRTSKSNLGGILNNIIHRKVFHRCSLCLYKQGRETNKNDRCVTITA